MSRLGLRQGIAQRMQQRLALQPRMLQSVQVLQLPAGDLEAWLGEQAADNAALSVEPASLDAGAEPRPGPGRGAAGRAATDAYDEMLRNQPERPPSLAEAVERELAARDLDPELEEWVRFLVSCLDDAGYLAPSDEELVALAENEGLVGAGTRRGRSLLGSAIAALQDMEPRGLGARNAIEALLLQLDPSDPDYPLLCALLEDFVDELARNHQPAVAKALGLDLDDLERLIGALRELDPRPVARLVETAAPPLRPDLVALPDGEGFVVELARGALPAVRLDPDAVALASDEATDPTTRRYLKERLERASWVVDAVAQRGATLLRVAEAALRRQTRFLREGPTALAPLRMAEVAGELGLAVSTVSRAVAGKHVQTPFGIVPLRSFFQAAASESGAGPARDAVRDRVQALVEGEDPARPLSDEDLVARLAEAGVRVARRTVAKYRKELGIPSSYKRRRFSG